MLWLKAFHIIAVVCWFAALFYLPRLFVYHAQCEDSAGRERFTLMEYKLYKIIGTPSMIATVLFGASLMHVQWQVLLHSYWIWAKLFFIGLLIAYHFSCGAHMKRLASGTNTHSHVYFRFFNEAPVIMLIAIVVLAVVKPF